MNDSTGSNRCEGPRSAKRCLCAMVMFNHSPLLPLWIASQTRHLLQSTAKARRARPHSAYACSQHERCYAVLWSFPPVPGQKTRSQRCSCAMPNPPAGSCCWAVYSAQCFPVDKLPTKPACKCCQGKHRCHAICRVPTSDEVNLRSNGLQRAIRPASRIVKVKAEAGASINDTPKVTQARLVLYIVAW